MYWKTKLCGRAEACSYGLSYDGGGDTLERFRFRGLCTILLQHSLPSVSQNFIPTFYLEITHCLNLSVK